ncbi:MAG: hypothetical protein NC205_08385 [Prevotella sp.]|nr:hypothetical protein [Alistipes senegalensis]MCM1358601.1 hypothetical protein [Prevotella sp.]MCM1474595.1 hypothetical protein [Muribaculaceae bacterium]
MKKSDFYFILLVLLDIVSIVVADGSIIEIKGIIAYFIFALSVVINVISARKYKRIFQKIILSMMIFAYIMTGAVFLIRQDNRIVSQNKDGRYIYITYEINPGAIGHLSYMDNVYYSLIDTDLLTVRIVKSTKHYRYRG